MGRPRTEGAKVYTFWKTNKKTGIQYLVERTQQYNPEKKRMETISEKTLSQRRIDENSEQEACRPKKPPVKKNSDEALTAAQNQSRLTRILEWIGRESGIDDDVMDAYRQSGTDQKIISCARYLLATNGRPLLRICEWELTHPLPFREGFSKDILCRLLEELGKDKEGRANFFRNRAERLGSSGLLVLACETREAGMSFEIQEGARSEFDRRHGNAKEEKALVLYDPENNQHIAFQRQPRDLPKILTVPSAIYQLKEMIRLKRVLLVFDGDSASEMKLFFCYKTNLDFLVRVEISESWIKNELDQIVDELVESHTSWNTEGAVAGKTVCIIYTFNVIGTETEEEHIRKKMYLHVYLDLDRRQAACADFLGYLDSLKQQLSEGTPLESMSREAQEDARRFLIITQNGKKVLIDYNESEIKEALKYEGIFALVGRGKYPESRETDLSLAAYRIRENVQKQFVEADQDVDGEDALTWNDETYIGKKMVQLVRLGYEDWFSAKLDSLKKELLCEVEESDRTGKNKTKAGRAKQLYDWLNERSLVQILDWYDAYETAEVSNRIRQLRWSDAQLAMDRYFFERLGIE